MPEVQCPCGKKYKLPDTAVGKKAKCKSCGNIFTVEPEDTGPIPIADDFDFGGEVDAALPRGDKDDTPATATSTPFDPTKLPPPIIETAGGDRQSDVDYSRYFANLFDSLIFVRRPADLITFIVMWAGMTVAKIVLPYAPIIGLFGSLIIVGWFCAFRFNVISGAASGDPELPNVTPDGEWWEGVILPLLSWLGSYALAFLPAIFGMLLAFQAGWMTADDLMGLAQEDTGMLVRDAFVGGALMVGVLFLFGIFIWPMLVLCIALGGFSDVIRVDCITVTLVRTFPIYLLTSALVFGAEFIQPLFTMIGDGIPLLIIGVGINVYLQIVSLRAIGLYYHHFKSKFSFAWG